MLTKGKSGNKGEIIAHCEQKRVLVNHPAGAFRFT